MFLYILGHFEKWSLQWPTLKQLHLSNHLPVSPFSQFYQFCKFENASQNSLPVCFVQFLSLVVIRFHNLRHFWNSQRILIQKWPRFWKLFKDRWRYGTKHGRWQMLKLTKQAGAELGQAQPQLGLRLANMEI